MCRWCHQPCGDREFCSPECHDELCKAERELAGPEDLCVESEGECSHLDRAA
jgi:hypothetical protein